MGRQLEIPGKNVWELQAQLKQWHEQEYAKEYPNSVFYTGRTLHPDGYDALTDAEKEHKEWVAYRLNRMLFALGCNISDNFREGGSS